MTVSERAAARSVAAQRKRAEDEVRALVEAGLAVLRRRGRGRTDGRRGSRRSRPVDARVLPALPVEGRARARGLRTGSATPLRAGSRRSCAKARLAPAALETWVDEMLSLGFEPRRSRRTKVLAAEGARAQADFPEEFAAILAGAVEPLEAVLRGAAESGSGARRMVGLRGHVGARGAEAAAARRSNGTTRVHTCCGSACRRSGFSRT